MEVLELSDAWRKLVRLVVNEGKPAAPRDIGTIEVENVEVDYIKPTYTFTNKLRRLNPVFHLVELMYFMDGRNDKLLIEYIKKMNDFVNKDTNRFDGSYGPSIYESLPFVIQKLKSDNLTRQAIIPILRMQHVASFGSKDFPCNIVIGLRIRNNALNMNVVTRSQDLYRGFLYDTLEFQLLQSMLANLFKVNVGKYHHTIFSLHLYEDDLEKSQRASVLQQENSESDGPRLPQFSTFDELWDFCHVRCQIADYAAYNTMNPGAILGTMNLGVDDMSRAIVAYATRRTDQYPLGPYTKWVNKWLE